MDSEELLLMLAALKFDHGTEWLRELVYGGER